MEDETVSHKRKRGAINRSEEILEAAARLFASKGFHRTTTKEIAEAAHISEGTLYNYFENKEDLLFGILNQLGEVVSLEAQLHEKLPINAKEFFIAMLRQRKALADENANMQQAILAEIMTDANLRQRYYQELLKPSLELLKEHIQRRMSLDHIRPVNTAATARVITGLFLGLNMLQLMGDPEMLSNWDGIVETTTSILFDGLAPKVG